MNGCRLIPIEGIMEKHNRRTLVVLLILLVLGAVLLYHHPIPIHEAFWTFHSP